MAVLGLCFCARAFSSCGKRGPLFIAVRGPLTIAASLLLRSTGSRCAGSAIVAHGPSCSVACGIFPDQGSNPCPLHWQADSQPLRHQGSPYFCLFKYIISCLTSAYVYIVKIQIKNITDTSSQSWRFPGLAILSVAKTVIEKALIVVHYQKFQIAINILVFSSSLWMNMLFTSISRPFLSLHLFSHCITSSNTMFQKHFHFCLLIITFICPTTWSSLRL